jgi:uncharacterized protein YkwD
MLVRICGALLVAALTSPLCAAAAAGAPACPQAGEDAVICEINAERRAVSLPPVSANPKLALAARRHARDMVRRQYFSHMTLGGRSMVDRLTAAGYLTRGIGRWAVGEVLAWGSGTRSTAAAAVDAWMHSPPHRRVLLFPVYREIGVGIEPGTPFGAPGATFAAELGSTGL